MDIPVRKVAPGEAKGLAAFAESCFRETFGYLFPEQAMDHLCSRAFAPAVLGALIDQGAWVAEGPEGWRGYVALSTDPCPVDHLPEPHLELARLYVARQWHRQGVSGALMAAFMDEARRRGTRGVWLEAFEGNPRALGFFRRWGFQDLGAQVQVKEGVHLPHRILGLTLD
jgi:GNAT superfamily N-acetyltransferase